jgi:hypothetical protein
MSVKMIVTDLDGTLLRTDKTISEYTKAVLSRCRKAGIKVVYATGRGGSAEIVAPAVLFDGRITMNGAIAKTDDTLVYERFIPYKTARPVLVACDKRGIRITSEINDMHYSNFAVSDLWQNMHNFEIVDFLRHDKNAEKLYTPNPTQEDISFIEKLLPHDLYLVVTMDGNGFLGQIMHKDATKAKAAAALARYWHIFESDVVAFGDDYNDIDLLSFSGTGVAMGNAVDEVKTIAGSICLDNDEDGIAKWIDEHVL